MLVCGSEGTVLRGEGMPERAIRSARAGKPAELPWAGKPARSAARVPDPRLGQKAEAYPGGWCMLLPLQRAWLGNRVDGRPPVEPGASRAGQRNRARGPLAVGRRQSPTNRACCSPRAVGGADPVAPGWGNGGRDSVQRAPVATPKHPVNPQSARNDVLDLLNGFEDLAGAAVNDGGRHLDSIPFGTDLSSAHRSLLERIRTALIEAQEKSPDARRAAVAQWPALEARLGEAVDQARKMGLPPDFLATVSNNLAAVGEMYVHAPHRGGTRIETAADYIDVLNGLNDLVFVLRQQGLDKTDAVVATNIGATNKKQREDLAKVSLGSNLNAQHRQLLENVRAAFILVRTETPGSPAAALTAWRALQGDLRLAMKRMPKFLVDPTDRSTLHLGNDAAELATTLNGLGTALFVGGAYTEAHAKAIKETNLQAPDLVLQVARYKEAVRELSEAEKLANKGLQLTGEDAISAVLEWRGSQSSRVRASNRPGTRSSRWLRHPARSARSSRSGRNRASWARL